MALIAQVNDLFQVVVKGRMENQETCNVLHFKATTPGGDVLIEIVQALASCYVSTLMGGLSTQWVVKNFTYKRVSPTLSPEFIYVPEPLFYGADGGDALPSFCSALLSIRTAEGGRSKRGRMYIPGLPEIGCKHSQIDVTQITWPKVVAFAACLANKFIEMEDLGTSKFRIGVYSRKIGGSTFPYGAAGFTPATEILTTTQIATTRSRKVGRGS